MIVVFKLHILRAEPCWNKSYYSMTKKLYTTKVKEKRTAASNK